MKRKIVFLDADSVGNLKALSEFSKLGEYTQYGVTRPEQRIERIRGCSVVITNKVIIDREVMDACDDLRLICIAATGMNNVDLDYAREKKILVRNVAGYSTESVAQSTFSMLFHLLHHNTYFDRYVKDGSYAESPVFTHHGREFWELKGKIWGIIGLGTIGKRVAEIASAFGCEVCYTSTSGKNLDTGYKHLPLGGLLESSDVVSIHCPLNERTQNLVGKDELSRMKPTAYLLNMGRGGIVNEADLTLALDKQWIAGAGIDVMTREPISKSNPLVHCKNPESLFITPHIAWASLESRNLLIGKLVRHIQEFIDA
ncbi:MAG: D-2-hydroxyacid dehydrogenase [Bacteroidales bacterium]|nr:D-2-hydroxyacid dehydrogenase [Bacteroidales bacterium]